ncbi:MAG: PaaI family thioesterase, partial [Marinobacter sp.]
MSEASQNLHITGGKDLPGFHNMLGYRQVSWEQDKAVLALDLKPEHLNLGGVIHGGVLSSLLDIVMA